uniref:Putative secreted protein n=1 Tax=Anopheles marajoara TaxID=58244 RepID=A0A2M4CGL8_9DIPT
MSVSRRCATLLRLVLPLLLLRCLHPLAIFVSGLENALALLQEYKRKQKVYKATPVLLPLVAFRCICT